MINKRILPKIPFLHQPDQMDCGATCLAMVAKHYGKNYTVQKLREMCSATRAGVSMLGISDAAEKLGFKTIGVRADFKKLVEDAPLPFIAHWRQEHFVVVYDVKIKTNKHYTVYFLRHLPIIKIRRRFHKSKMQVSIEQDVYFNNKR
jgi:ATP-binding cassette subfamily B protein